MKIAFIGLGHMGGGMAPNLVKAGHDVQAFDLSEEALAAAEQAGCNRAASAAEAVKDAEVVVTMLPAAKHVLDVYRSQVFGNAPESALLIDCSTIDVGSARTVAEEAQAKGYAMVDAPVSGGIAAAAGGTLAFMVGGSDEAFAEAQPILEPMAKAVIHAGEAGAGQAAKICNNMILGATMAVTCEAFVLAQKLGLDPKVFYDISSQASGQSWSMTSYCPVPGVGPKTPADNDYDGGFAAALMLKDLKLAMQAAEQAGVEVEMGEEAEEMYEAFVEKGGGSKDFSGIIKMIDGSWSE
ncbi:3-hydroxyisobutyrate dehydrogenase [Sphingomonas sabuli]|uniref:3-hydroxyisobutyrate dehydrogenase n=1 Tax=Sphingomonas sabuli TaxID=2764186 RepID=A0A7G9L551_9SPHN|nr:3-hydroxyisobutyrate dehydrogenase [Sphingomonas sabuli]QNM83750.1 3-hydroxyisobutyrate dehydrogenase [Sphingomonas sabuli]